LQEYKDHGFVIDLDEARSDLGEVNLLLGANQRRRVVLAGAIEDWALIIDTVSWNRPEQRAISKRMAFLFSGYGANFFGKMVDNNSLGPSYTDSDGNQTQRWLKVRFWNSPRFPTRNSFLSGYSFHALQAPNWKHCSRDLPETSSTL